MSVGKSPRTGEVESLQLKQPTSPVPPAFLAQLPFLGNGFVTLPEGGIEDLPRRKCCVLFLTSPGRQPRLLFVEGRQIERTLHRLWRPSRV